MKNIKIIEKIERIHRIRKKLNDIEFKLQKQIWSINNINHRLIIFNIINSNKKKGLYSIVLKKYTYYFNFFIKFILYHLFLILNKWY